MLHKPALVTLLLCISLMLASHVALSQSAEIAISDLAWNFDGTKLALARTDGTIEIVDRQGKSLAVYEVFPEPRFGQEAVVSVAWSPTQANMLAVAGEFDAKVLDISRTPPEIWRELAPFVASTPLVYPFEKLSWSPDGSKIAVYGQSGGVGEYSERLLMIWATWLQGQLLAVDHRYSDGYLFTSIAWNPVDANLLAIAGSKQDFGGEVRLWDVQNNRVLWQVQEPYRSIVALAWSPDGSQLAYAAPGTHDDDDIIGIIHDVADGTELTYLSTGITSGVYYLSWSPGQYLAASGRTLKIWDVEAEQVIAAPTLECRDIVWNQHGDLACNIIRDGVQILSGLGTSTDTSGTSR